MLHLHLHFAFAPPQQPRHLPNPVPIRPIVPWNPSSAERRGALPSGTAASVFRVLISQSCSSLKALKQMHTICISACSGPSSFYPHHAAAVGASVLLESWLGCSPSWRRRGALARTGCLSFKGAGRADERKVAAIALDEFSNVMVGGVLAQGMTACGWSVLSLCSKRGRLILHKTPKCVMALAAVLSARVRHAGNAGEGTRACACAMRRGGDGGRAWQHRAHCDHHVRRRGRVTAFLCRNRTVVASGSTLKEYLF